MGYTAQLLIADGNKVHGFTVEEIVLDSIFCKEGEPRVDFSVKGYTLTNMIPFMLKIPRRNTRVKRPMPITGWWHLERFIPKPVRVIFNDPATIVFWEDGTKTVAKAQAGDLFNKQRGVVVCMLKKMMGNDNSYNKLMNALEKEAAKWVSSDE